MGFNLPGKSIQSGTSAHSSALKMVAEQKAASALKEKASALKTDGTYAGAVKENPELEKLIAARNAEKYIDPKDKSKGKKPDYKKSAAYGDAQNAINKAYYGADFKDKYKGTATSTEKDKPRVEKTSSVDTDKSKTVYRKDGKVKKKTTKSVDENSDGRLVNKQKSTYRKDGLIKKYVHKRKDSGHDQEGEYRTKTKTKVKWDKKGNTKQKEVDVRDGRRTVTKTDKQGNVTTKSRRTLKGILTGKGKKDSPAKHTGKHPTEAIAAHEGHLAVKQTKGTRSKLAVDAAVMSSSMNAKTAKLKKKE